MLKKPGQTLRQTENHRFNKLPGVSSCSVLLLDIAYKRSKKQIQLEVRVIQDTDSYTRGTGSSTCI